MHKIMLSKYLKYRKNTESKNPKAVKTKNRRKMVSSNCEVCSGKKLKSIKEQEAKGFLGSTLNKIPLLHPFLI